MSDRPRLVPGRTCDTCRHRHGSDACGGCYHAPEEGFVSETGKANHPHWEPRHLVRPEHLAVLRKLAEDGVAEDALFELPCREMVQLLDHLDALGEALDLEAGGYCRICGCTEHLACEGGCSWVAEGLCSSCQYQVEPAEDGAEDGSEGWQVVDLLTGEPLGDEDGTVIYLERRAAERSAQLGRVLVQVCECAAGCGWTGRYPLTTGCCPACGDGVLGTDRWTTRADGRAADLVLLEDEEPDADGDGFGVGGCEEPEWGTPGGEG